MKYLLAIVLLSGCATLSQTTHDAEQAADVVDQGAQKLQAAISVLRKNVQPYAAVAVQLCDSAPVDPSACAELDALAGRLVDALDTTQAALDLYKAGKGDFADAYEALGNALDLAESYARKVLQLHDRARV